MAPPRSIEDETRSPIRDGVVLSTILGFWLFYIVVVTLRSFVLDFPSQGELAYRRVIVTAIGIALTIGYWKIIAIFDHKSLQWRVVVAAVAAIPCALAIALVNYYIFNVYDAASLFADNDLRRAAAEPHFAQELAEVALSRYFFLIAWAALYLALGYAHDMREIERRAAAYAQAAQQSELRALRYQVNPHFLFNTLNSLSALVLAGRNAEAESMILNLATFFRSSLSHDPTADMPLEDEIELQQLYLDVEAVRFPGRLDVSIDLPETLRQVLVPGLILQPLVENAVKHGVARSTVPVAIRITASEADGNLRLCVANQGGADLPDRSGNGIGLANVRLRLAARFGDDAIMTSRFLPGCGFEVVLTMPKIVHG